MQKKRVLKNKKGLLRHYVNAKVALRSALCSYMKRHEMYEKARELGVAKPNFKGNRRPGTRSRCEWRMMQRRARRFEAALRVLGAGKVEIVKCRVVNGEEVEFE